MSNSEKKVITQALWVLGDTHSLCIIYHLDGKSLRFCELQRALNGLNPTTLSNRLKKLEDEDIIARDEETVDKISVIYSLTKKGRDILPIIEDITKFADKYYGKKKA